MDEVSIAKVRDEHETIVGDGQVLLTVFEELGLGDWVDSLPHGLETRVGERGESLSVGERQLVSLARAQIGGAQFPQRRKLGRAAPVLAGLGLRRSAALANRCLSASACRS